MTPNGSIDIRGAEAADAEAIAAFNAEMARETESKELDLPTVKAGVKALLAAPERGFYLVAQCDGQPAGCLMVTSEWSDWRNGVFWWIQSVYVRPEYRRRGVFRALYREVEKRAISAQGVCGLRLYVEQNNAVAQRTYKSMGMEATPYRVFEVEFGNT